MSNKGKEAIKEYIKKIQQIKKDTIKGVIDSKGKKKEFSGQDNEALSQWKKDKEQNRNLQKEYANKSFWFMVAWSTVLGILLFIYLFCPIPQIQWVFVTLIGSTTISLFRMFGVIIHGLFSNNNNQA